MGREIIQPVVEAVKEAVKDDKQLTPEDLEKREISRAVRQIQGLWNPGLEQTPDVILDRNDVLHTILQVSVAHDIDHQQIADWIYGHGKVNVEKYFDQLWTNDYARFRDGHVPPQKELTKEIIRQYETDPATRLPVKRLSLVATPKDLLEIVFYEFRDGRRGFNYNHFRLREGTRSDWRPVGGWKPTEEVKNFDEANLRVKEIIQALKRSYSSESLDSLDSPEKSLRELAKKCLESSDEEFANILNSHKNNEFLRALVLEALATFNPRSDSRWGRVRNIITRVGGAGLLEQFDSIAYAEGRKVRR